MNFLTEHILAQKHSPIRNYILPGLTSWLIGEQTPGKPILRLFEASRTQHEVIVPHSHRYDFQALVLRGSVWNTEFKRLDASSVYDEPEDEDIWQICAQSGKLGSYKTWLHQKKRFYKTELAYVVGDVYRMKASQFHSIKFSASALVLMKEEPPTSEVSYYLQPVVDGEVLNTFKTEDWMFT